MDEIMKQVRKQIEEISGGLYYCIPSPSRPPYLDIYTTSWKSWEWVCRVELLMEDRRYLIIFFDRPSRIVKGDCNLVLEEVLKELISNE